MRHILDCPYCGIEVKQLYSGIYLCTKCQATGYYQV